MSTLRICLVVPSLHFGGMERVVSQLSGFLCTKANTDIHLILYGKAPVIQFSLPDKLRIHLPSNRFNAKFRAISTLARLFYLRREILKTDPKVVLSFGEYWNSFVLLSVLDLHYPVFVSDRCQPGKKLGAGHELLRKKLYPRAKGIIAQTYKAAEIYRDLFWNSRITVIGNPISLVNEFREDKERENIVLTVGRLINTKNHDRLIQVFVRINMPGWRLIIIGDDAQKQNNMKRLKSLIKRLGSEDKVTMAGSKTDVGQYYAKSKIFAFTSESEGFPNVIGEAQSFGLPVIAFDCVAGPADLINADNGFLIPLFNYDMFQEKLKLLMENAELRERFGRNGRNSIKRFSVDLIGEKYYNLLDSAV